MADREDLSEPQAAAALRICGKTLARWRSAGHGPAYSRTPTGRIRYRWEDLVTFKQSMRIV